MPIVVAEKWDSRETTLGEDSSVDLRYVIRGTDNDVDAHVALLANSPDLYGNLVFRYAQMNFGAAMATAARVTVAEVREVTTAPLAHDRIQLSGVYVDRVVVGPATGGKA